MRLGSSMLMIMSSINLYSFYITNNNMSKETSSTKCSSVIFSSKIANVLSLDLDDIDKLILIESWFKQFTSTQKANVIKILWVKSHWHLNKNVVQQVLIEQNVIVYLVIHGEREMLESEFTCEICDKCQSSTHVYGKHWCTHCWLDRDTEKFPWRQITQDVVE